MAINTSPIFTATPITQITPATGTGTVVGYTLGNAPAGTNLIFTADGTYGSYIQKIRWRALGTNVATVCRVFLNTTAAPAAGTSVLLDELSLPATTSNAAAALALFELPLNFAITAGYKLYVGYGTQVAAGYDITVIAGNYTAV